MCFGDRSTICIARSGWKTATSCCRTTTGTMGGTATGQANTTGPGRWATSRSSRSTSTCTRCARLISNALGDTAWVQFLGGENPDYPLQSLQEALEQVRRTGQRLMSLGTGSRGGAAGTTRGFGASPVSTTALVNLTLGANDPGGSSHGPNLVHAQVRHFDPVRRRPGLPEDVAALVERIRGGGGHPDARQHQPLAGPYGRRAERRLRGARNRFARGRRTYRGGRRTARHRAGRPGAGGTITIRLERFAHQPTLAFPGTEADNPSAIVRRRARLAPPRTAGVVSETLH